MIKVGITGQSGFVGTHLYNTLGLQKDLFERVPFDDDFFKSDKKLKDFVKNCDVIVHLASMNRHNDLRIIYDTNIGLVNQIISSCELTKSKPHILFSSSIQEDRDNQYGKSKKEGRLMFETWALKEKAFFTGFVMPNIYGPFGHPYYNSVVATFCHQLTHNEQPRIDLDADVKFIYINDVVKLFINNILEVYSKKENSKSWAESASDFISTIRVSHTSEIKVSQLLAKIQDFKDQYFLKGVIPNLSNEFDRNLFNTFVCYIDHINFFPFSLELKTDPRGSFVETVKLNSGGQVSFSTTKPGVTRGNHFHTRKAERFAVIKGKAVIEIRRIGTDKKLTFELDGSKPSFVDMPVWFTHNITNVGNDDLFTLFWISEHFDEKDTDTYFEEV